MRCSTSFDSEALAWFARRFDPSLALDGHWPSPNWSDGRRAIDEMFALDRTTHFLRHHRGLLHRFREPEVTRALCAMLLEIRERTVVRCQALLDALEGPSAPRISRVDRITADQADRIDLAVHFRDGDGLRHCLVLEAKLESELSATQLPKYLAGLKREYRSRDQRHLWVIAPRRTHTAAVRLGEERNVEWRFSTWRRLLIEWQRELPDEPATDVSSLFAEIWKRVGGP